jgi:hypothetical protein
MTMHHLRLALLALLAALVIGLSGVASANAARHKKVRAAAPPPAPVYAQPASRPATRPTNRPTWAAPQECLTDDGYGRFLPCAIGDGR